MSNDIEQIAPTPWRRDTVYSALILDANGGTVQPQDCRDRIIACVNACKGLNLEGVPELLAVCGEVDDCFKRAWTPEAAWTKATLALARRVHAALLNVKVPDA